MCHHVFYFAFVKKNEADLFFYRLHLDLMHGLLPL